MAENGQKWAKMAKNRRKWPKMVENGQNGRKWPGSGRKWPKMAKNGRKGPKIGQKWPKMAENGSKRVKMSRNRVKMGQKSPFWALLGPREPPKGRGEPAKSGQKGSKGHKNVFFDRFIPFGCHFTAFRAETENRFFFRF